ncbi:MAG: RAD51C protein [Monoraphidium minutum]|nr:MAG: RAD51C protein [Monoraphidium minutum]
MEVAPRAPLAALPLAPHTRQALLAAGLSTVADLEPFGSPDALASACGLDPSDASEALFAAFGAPHPGWRLTGAASARELLESEAARPRISTYCTELDALLAGGVAAGSVTEFCGVPGVGKTQLGIQLAVNAQIPRLLGGRGGKAVYIDTEGSFMADRAVDIASATVRHISGAARANGDPAHISEAEKFTVQSVLDGILYFRVQDHTQQLALIRTLDALLASIPEVALVVIDSVTFHFRQDWPDAGLRSRLLAGVAQDAAALAEGRHLAVVFMNQVTTKVVGGGPDGGVLVPALGESWGQASSTRVALFWDGPQRRAHALKAPLLPEGLGGQPRGAAAAAGAQRDGRQAPRAAAAAAVPYDVTVDGVRSSAAAAP